MSAIDDLLRLSHVYGAAVKIEQSTVSWRLFGDNKKLAALVAGKDIQVKRLEAAIHWFSDNWPDGAEWPEGVTRPERTEAAAVSHSEASAA